MHRSFWRELSPSVTPAALSKSHSLLSHEQLRRWRLPRKGLLVTVVAVATASVPLLAWRLVMLMKQHALQVVLLRWLVPFASLSLGFVLAVWLCQMPVFSVYRLRLAV